jgi:hypothetical protein
VNFFVLLFQLILLRALLAIQLARNWMSFYDKQNRPTFTQTLFMGTGTTSASDPND